jgi:hypothetical protein
VVGGRLELLTTCIVCQLHDGERTIACTIARQTLRDLGDFHRLRVSEEAVLSHLLPEIERLANEKFHAGCIDQNGDVTIGTADLLRYGFGLPGANAAE